MSTMQSPQTNKDLFEVDLSRSIGYGGLTPDRLMRDGINSCC
jgi:hypothetical protein